MSGLVLDRLEVRTGDRLIVALEAVVNPGEVLTIMGPSGSGKSTMARRLAPKYGGVILRSDEIRKRLWGCAPLQALPREAYHPDQSARVYGQMLHEALLTLKAGRSVVLDGVFLRGPERDAVRALAKRVGAEFEGLWLEASPTVLSARIRARSHDASDADQSVLAAQLSQDPGDIDWYRSSDKPLFSET